jgi:hypothetical protein
VRVLHLIDGSGEPGPRLDLCAGAAGLLAARTSGEHASCVVGPAAARRRASALGAPRGWHVAPVLRRPEAAARGVRGIGESWSPDVVQCWGAEMLGVARLAFPAGTPLVAVIEGRGGGHGLLVEWFGAPLTNAVLLCYDEGDRAALADEWPGVEVRRVPPGVVPRPGLTNEPRRVREALGIDPGEIAVLLVGDAPQADALRFAFLMGLMQVAGRSVVGVMPTSASGRRRGSRLRRRAIHRLRVVASDRTLLELASACDLGVWDAGGTGPVAHWTPDAGAGAVAVASVLAAGVPVVAPACPTFEALYPAAAREACLARNSSLPELARLLMGLANDQAAARAIGHEVRAHAASMDGSGAFVRAVSDAWARVARSAGAEASAPALGLAT